MPWAAAAERVCKKRTEGTAVTGTRTAITMATSGPEPADRAARPAESAADRRTNSHTAGAPRRPVGAFRPRGRRGETRLKERDGGRGSRGTQTSHNDGHEGTGPGRPRREARRKCRRQEDEQPHRGRASEAPGLSIGIHTF